MLGNNPDKKIQSQRETYAPLALGSRYFSPVPLKMSVYLEESLAIDMAFVKFVHILSEIANPTIVLTDR